MRIRHFTSIAGGLFVGVMCAIGQVAPEATPTVTPPPPPVEPTPAPEAAMTPAATPSPAEAQPAAMPEEGLTPAAGDFLPQPIEGEMIEQTTEIIETEGALPGEMSPGELPDPNLLIPDDLTSPDFPPPAAPTESADEKQRRLKIRFQDVKLQAMKDTSIRNLKEQADKAKTDEAKRAALREYYKMLFAKIRSIDPELTERSNALERAYVNRVSQFRVEPTIPLQPPPTPEPLGQVGGE